MHFEQSDESIPFEQEVRQRLNNIENVLINFAAQNDLIQEMVRKDIHALNSVKQKEQFFVVTTVKTPDDVPLFIRISGQTYDIRKKIKEFGPAVWKGELKAWELEFSDEQYHNILEYLHTLTTNIREELLVAVV